MCQRIQTNKQTLYGGRRKSKWIYSREKKDKICGVILELRARFDINEYGADLPPRSRTQTLAGSSLSVNKTMNGLRHSLYIVNIINVGTDSTPMVFDMC